MSRRRSAFSSIRRRIYIITVFAIYIVCIFSLFSLLLAVDSDLDQQHLQQQQLHHQIHTHDDDDDSFSNNNASRTARQDSFAGMIDRALEKEFTEGDQIQENDAGGFNNSVNEQQVMTGYLLAGSLVGPGGLSVVSEMVQVETVAQFGVIFLLFALGLEFSLVKLRVVRAVAVMGGLLQIFLFMCLCGITASLCGGKPSEGVFVGAFLSMSSTAVVLKYLMEKNSVNALHGQVTVGTLILQDCAVGLLFALLPILGGTSGVLQGVISMTKSLVTLMAFLIALTIMSRTCVPWFLKLMMSLSSQTNELYQLAAVAFCLLVAWCSDKLGLSFELGSFAAGVMIATTDLAQHTLEQKMTPITYHPTHDRTLPPSDQVISTEERNILLRHFYVRAEDKLKSKRAASDSLTPEQVRKHPRASTSEGRL